MNTKHSIKCGDIYYVNLGDYKPNIQGGKRPCIILGNKKGLNTSQICQVIPLTTAQKAQLPVHMQIKIRDTSTLLIEQIQTICKSQIGNYVTSVPDTTLEEIKKRLLVQLGL